MRSIGCSIRGVPFDQDAPRGGMLLSTRVLSK